MSQQCGTIWNNEQHIKIKETPRCCGSDQVAQHDNLVYS